MPMKPHSFAIAARPDQQSAALERMISARLTENQWKEDPKAPDYVIAVGGDGTFLHAAHSYLHAMNRASFVGIRTGTLGFFMDYTADELEPFLTDLLEDRFMVEAHPVLEASAGNDVRYAFNEVRIDNPLRTQTVEVYLDGAHFEDVRGSGVCISTQLGSTALNRSLGGAVIMAGLPVLELTEIACIHHAVYRSLGAPFIIPDTMTIDLRSASFDGAVFGTDAAIVPLEGVSSIHIQKSDYSFRILRRLEANWRDRMKRLF